MPGYGTRVGVEEPLSQTSTPTPGLTRVNEIVYPSPSKLEGPGYFVCSSPSEPEFPAKVTVISKDGDSLCIDGRVEDDCGFPIILPGDRDEVKVGADVIVREIWLPAGNDIKYLAFVVRPR